MNWIVGIISVFLVILFAASCAGLGRDLVCFQDHCFEVELAQTDEERARGLMFRESLGPDQGMLFVFSEEGEHPFWMKNTLIPLDIIWLNQEQEIIFIGDNIQPCREDSCPMVRPDSSAKYVLELNGRRAEEIGLSVGTKLEFDLTP